MAQTEYEQKKRECWEEYTTISPQYKAFSFAFDRAYALGKQEKDADDDKILKVSKQLFCRLCADADDYINENLEEEDSDYGYYQGRSDALHELYRGECKDAEDTVIQGWVARDEGADCSRLYNSKPYRKKKGFEDGYWVYGLEIGLGLDPKLFPDLTWESDPIEVELIIKRKKK